MCAYCFNSRKCVFCMEEVKSKIFIKTNVKAALKRIMMVISVRLILIFFDGSCKADIYIYKSSTDISYAVFFGCYEPDADISVLGNMSPICTFFFLLNIKMKCF